MWDMADTTSRVDVMWARHAPQPAGLVRANGRSLSWTFSPADAVLRWFRRQAAWASLDVCSVENASGAVWGSLRHRSCQMHLQFQIWYVKVLEICCLRPCLLGSCVGAERNDLESWETVLPCVIDVKRPMTQGSCGFEPVRVKRHLRVFDWAIWGFCFFALLLHMLD